MRPSAAAAPDIAFARALCLGLRPHLPEGLFVSVGPEAMVNARSAAGTTDRIDVGGQLSSATDDPQGIVGTAVFLLDMVFERFSDVADAPLVATPPPSRGAVSSAWFAELAASTLAFGWHRADGWRLTLGTVAVDVPADWHAFGEW